jgi:hypothetical protein
MATFYYSKDTGYLWPKTTEPTERELKHLAGEGGVTPWGTVDVEESVLEDAQSHRCVVSSEGSIALLPEDQWPENQVGDDA